jgi:hypothetical protein
VTLPLISCILALFLRLVAHEYLASMMRDNSLNLLHSIIIPQLIKVATSSGEIVADSLGSCSSLLLLVYYDSCRGPIHHPCMYLVYSPGCGGTRHQIGNHHTWHLRGFLLHAPSYYNKSSPRAN